MNKSGTFTFGLFIIAALAAIFVLLRSHGHTQWGLVAVLVGILVLRVVLFLVNLRQQRRHAEHGSGPVKIETRLGLEEDVERQIQHHRHQHPTERHDV